MFGLLALPVDYTQLKQPTTPAVVSGPYCPKGQKLDPNQGCIPKIKQPFNVAISDEGEPKIPILGNGEPINVTGCDPKTGQTCGSGAGGTGRGDKP